MTGSGQDDNLAGVGDVRAVGEWTFAAAAAGPKGSAARSPSDEQERPEGERERLTLLVPALGRLDHIWIEPIPIFPLSTHCEAAGGPAIDAATVRCRHTREGKT